MSTWTRWRAADPTRPTITAAHLTGTGMLLGTVAMAPEQVRGQTVDPRTDRGVDAYSGGQNPTSKFRRQSGDRLQGVESQFGSTNDRAFTC